MNIRIFLLLFQFMLKFFTFWLYWSSLFIQNSSLYLFWIFFICEFSQFNQSFLVIYFKTLCYATRSDIKWIVFAFCCLVTTLLFVSISGDKKVTISVFLQPFTGIGQLSFYSLYCRHSFLKDTYRDKTFRRWKPSSLLIS